MELISLNFHSSIFLLETLSQELNLFPLKSEHVSSFSTFKDDVREREKVALELLNIFFNFVPHLDNIYIVPTFRPLLKIKQVAKCFFFIISFLVA